MFAFWAAAGILFAAATGLILHRAASAASATDAGDATASPAADPRRDYSEKAIVKAEEPAPTLGADQLVAIRGMVQGLAQRDETLGKACARYAAQPQVISQLNAAAVATPLESPR